MYFRVFSVFNLILILVAASLSWTPAMVMAKFALFTRIALQVIMHPTINPERYKEIAYKKVSYHFNLPSGPVSPGPFCVGVMAQQCEVWFLDRSLFWHYLTPSFTAYYRLMITHLGLPEWQYNFTPYGPSPQAKVSIIYSDLSKQKI